MNETYGTTGGTQFWFVNQLAERTSQVYPEKVIGTLAYMYTEEPPTGLTMHPNTAVWLCHMFPSCDSHPIDSCPRDAEYKRRAEAWSQITDHLYIWHYITEFTHYFNPFPNFRAMSADMRFYRDIGVEGIYLQGMGAGGGGGEFSLLRPYYGMKLLWDPAPDPIALRRDFLKGYYGEAWKPIEDYIEMLHDKVENDNIHMHLYTNPAQGYLTDDIMVNAHEYFDQAEEAVKDDEEMLERVKVARMPLVYADMFPRNGYDIVDGGIAWKNDLIDFGVLNEFLDRMERHGFSTFREVGGEPETMRLIYLLLKANPEIKTIENEHLKVEVVPNLGGRALRIIHKTSGECVTAFNVKENMFFPFAGGLEDRVGETFRYYGWVEPASVKSLTADSITMTQDTLDGYELSKTYKLLSGQPVLQVETVLTNPADSVRGARLRSHLELNLGTVRSTRVSFASRSGTSVDMDMNDVVEGFREGAHFYDQDAPEGEWTFTGDKGLELKQRFDEANIDYTWIYSYPEDMGEVEVELWSERRQLAKDESITMTQEIEVGPAQ